MKGRKQPLNLARNIPGCAREAEVSLVGKGVFWGEQHKPRHTNKWILSLQVTEQEQKSTTELCQRVRLVTMTRDLLHWQPDSRSFVAPGRVLIYHFLKQMQ